MIKQLCDYIYWKLNDLKTTTTLNFVYNYDKSSFEEWLPSATVSPISSWSIILDNVSFQEIVPISIRIYEESWDKENIEDKMRQLTDDIINYFKSDYILWWLALKTDISANFGYTNELTYRVVEITLTITTSQEIGN